jgi:hypothetical protein
MMWLHLSRAPLVEASRNEVINVGADQPYTILELAEAVARAFGMECDVVHLPARQEVVHAFSSHEKAQRIFGASPSLGLEEGIDRMARWVKAAGIRPPGPLPGRDRGPSQDASELGSDDRVRLSGFRPVAGQRRLGGGVCAVSASRRSVDRSTQRHPR